jgi:hypothetical protein
MLPTAASQPKMIKAVRDWLAGDGDEAVGDGEIGQRLAAGVVPLRKKRLLVRAVQGTPLCDATLPRASDAVGKNAQAEFILEVFENRHRHNAGDLEHLQHPRPDVGQRIGAGSPGSRLLLLRWRTRVAFDAARGARGEIGVGCSGFLVLVSRTGGHVEHHLAVGHMKVRHRAQIIG